MAAVLCAWMFNFESVRPREGADSDDTFDPGGNGSKLFTQSEWNDLVRDLDLHKDWQKF